MKQSDVVTRRRWISLAISTISSILFMIVPVIAPASQSSPNYLIEEDVLDSGGGESTSPNFVNSSSIGQFSSGDASSPLYAMESGYWNDLTGDGIPPTTLASGGSYAFGALTNAGIVSVTLSPIDTGSGVATGYPRYCIDTANTCTPGTPYSTAFNVTCSMGSVCTQHVRYFAADNAGNTETINSVLVKQDLLPPNAPSMAGIASPSTNTLPTWSWVPGGGGNGTYQHRLDGAEWISTTSVSFQPLSGLADGPHTLNVQERDLAGNWSASGSRTVLIDTTGPILNISALQSESVTNNQVLNITGFATDASAFQNITLHSSATGTIALDPAGFNLAQMLKPGSNTITMTATDVLGNRSTDSRTIIYSQTTPALAVIKPADNSAAASAVMNIQGTVDAGANVDVIINGSAPQPAVVTGTTYTAAVNLASGSNTIEVTAIDASLHTNTVKRTVVYNTLGAAVTITDPVQDAIITAGTTTIKGTVSDAPGGATFELIANGQTYHPVLSGGAFEQAITLSTEQTYSVVAVVKDSLDTPVTTVQRNVIYTTGVASPGALMFSSPLNVQSNAQSVVVRSTGAQPLTINSISISGGDASQFSQANDCPGSLAIGNICTISVKFKPTYSSASLIASLNVNVAAPAISKAVSLTGVITPPASNATISPDIASPQMTGGTITFTAGGIGGSGNYEYRFWLKTAGVWTSMRDYSTTNTWTWNTASAAAGSYGVQVYVRNAGSSSKYEAVKTVNYVLIYPPTSDATLTPDVLSPQAVGNDITFTAGGIGGSGNYEYKFWLKTAGTWTTVQDYSTTNAWTWHTTGTPAGTYGVQVYVRNSGSSAMYEATKFMSYNLIYGPATGATISPNVASPQTAGAPVTFTAGGIGGSGNYEYKFWLKAAGVWTTVQGYSTTNTWVWDTTSLPPGTYRAQVYVRNVGSSAKYEAVLGTGYVIK